MSKLFSPIKIKGCNIKNRVAMPPMVCFGWADDSGMVSENHISHYEARAKGGAGLIIVEATCVTKSGRLADTQLGIWSDEHIEGLSKIAEACHRHGAAVLIQIHHAGAKTPEKVLKPAMAPSEGEKSRAITLEELHEIQQDFVRAALRAKKAGFDGIEVHGAHGYIISQFMSPLTNKREDQYGGAIENRMRFAEEIVKAIKKEAGEDFILGYRMGGNEPTLENGIHIAKSLEKSGVDLLHVSAGITGDEVPQVPEGFDYNWIVYIGTEIKKQVSIPVIVVNDIRTPERAEYLIDNNMADLAAIGRGHLVDAEWAKHAGENEPIVTCLKCPRCLWYTNGKNCPRNK